METVFLCMGLVGIAVFVNAYILSFFTRTSDVLITIRLLGLSAAIAATLLLLVAELLKFVPHH